MRSARLVTGRIGYNIHYSNGKSRLPKMELYLVEKDMEVYLVEKDTDSEAPNRPKQSYRT